jgi:hypothetical protein
MLHSDYCHRFWSRLNWLIHAPIGADRDVMHDRRSLSPSG